MFVVVIEKRISAKAGAKDWYVLLAVVFPFAPVVGTEVRLKSGVSVPLESVIYDPTEATFWTRTEPLLHPKPNAKKVAEELAMSADWDKAVVEEDLEAAKESLTKEGIRKLQQIIVQAQTRAMISKPIALPFDPKGPRRKHN